MDLFEHQAQKDPRLTPLAERMRPAKLADIVGQPDLVAPGSWLRQALENQSLPSLLLWGPPGSGKTSLAHVIANELGVHWISLSAVLSGVPELRKAIAEAESFRTRGKKTLLFIDEIHRFNKAQQDALLPHVERGTVILIGATTENPSFAINRALLSRARTVEIKTLGFDDIVRLLRSALGRDATLQAKHLQVTDEALATIARSASGDARRALGALELVTSAQAGSTVDDAMVQEAIQNAPLDYDKAGEGHYNTISAFIKSMRGSDPDAAIYWMMRMLEAGEEPLFVLRRMIIFASEDIGNADPRALQVAVSADAAFQRLGMPEGMFSLAQCCLYLASAPKSNASYTAWTAAQADVKRLGSLPVPKKLRNAPNTWMKSEGYGEGYRYPHDESGYAAGETYLPDKLVGTRYYLPKAAGYEAKMRVWLEQLRNAAKIRKNDDSES